MFYKSFSGILTIYGYLPQTSFSYFYSNMLLVLAILNLIASLVYFEVVKLNDIDLRHIISTSATYILQVAHCAVLANSVKNIGLRNEFYEMLNEFDQEIAKKFNSKADRQAEVYLNRQVLGGWILSVIFISSATYSIVKNDIFVIFWLRALPGILSIQLKYINIFFFVEQLKQRLVVYTAILDEMITEKTTAEFEIIELKKLYTKLIEIMGLINEIFGSDLIFMVMHNFLDVIFNIYMIFLDGFYSHNYSGVLSKLFLLTLHFFTTFIF